MPNRLRRRGMTSGWFAAALALAAPAPAALALDPALSAQFRALEHRLVAQGGLRVDPADPGYPDARAMLRDFDRIALGREYGAGSGLMRWEDRVTIDLMFGASVPEAQRTRVRGHVARYTRQLSDHSGHPVRLGGTQPNFTVFVVSEGERRGLGAHLDARAPGMAPRTRAMLVNMAPTKLCMVAAVPHADRTRGYRAAVAVIRAELPDRLLAACIEEEIAQGLGLPNDGREGTPSLFNDNAAWARLTRCDEQLLALLYHPRLRSGMSRAEALATAETILGGSRSALR